jgi:hypothetical protein
MKFSVYQSYLDELGVDIMMGDYIGYYETESKVRYYSVADDGRSGFRQSAHLWWI